MFVAFIGRFRRYKWPMSMFPHVAHARCSCRAVTCAVTAQRACFIAQRAQTRLISHAPRADTVQASVPCTIQRRCRAAPRSA